MSSDERILSMVFATLVTVWHPLVWVVISHRLVTTAIVVQTDAAFFSAYASIAVLGAVGAVMVFGVRRILIHEA